MKERNEWKTGNKRYLKELQKMFDIIENVQDEELKNKILLQFVKCDDLITQLAIERINNRTTVT